MAAHLLKLMSGYITVLYMYVNSIPGFEVLAGIYVCVSHTDQRRSGMMNPLSRTLEL